MKNWKISRLRICNFKPFEDLQIDFKGASLITLDGPNGFGKTSIFDAIELLLTGGVQRLIDLSKAIAVDQRRRQFDENLVWNFNKRGPIVLKVELQNKADGRYLYLARRAEVSELKNPRRNSPDNFDYFDLYRIDSLESEIYERKVEDLKLEAVLGDNFRKNFSLLNYLEQGQSKYLYSRNVTQRREGLDHLISTDKLTEKIERLSALELQVRRQYSGPEKERQKLALELQLSTINTNLSVSEVAPLYARLSSVDPVPGWDSAKPVLSANVIDFQNLITDFNHVENIFLNADELKVRLENRKIDDFLKDKSQEIFLAAKIGAHIGRYQGLKTVKESISLLSLDLLVLRTKADKVVLHQVGELSTSIDNRVEIVRLIGERDGLIKISSSHDRKLSLMVKAHEDLMLCYQQIGGDKNGECPFCGFDWPTYEILLEEASKSISRLKGEIEGTILKISRVLGLIEHELFVAATEVEERKAELEKQFNSSLFTDLESTQEKTKLIQKIVDRLAVYSINLYPDYTENSEVVARRVAEIKEKVLGLKVSESEGLISNWFEVYRSSFSSVEDVFGVSKVELKSKREYLDFCYAKECNDALLLKRRELQELVKTMAAGQRVKDRIAGLRQALLSVKGEYTKRTVSEIELIFHVYSGRLIQNYQRGLGLFILTGEDGRVLKFNSAEKSEHDAILSMSSGQVAAMSMAFFLALNKVYAGNPFVLIDDPVQSMDEINIASLSDLLRVEFADRQIILSNHEEQVSAFLRYKFKRSGLSQESIHMQFREQRIQ